MSGNTRALLREKAKSLVSYIQHAESFNVNNVLYHSFSTCLLVKLAAALAKIYTFFYLESIDHVFSLQAIGVSELSRKDEGIIDYSTDL